MPIQIRLLPGAVSDLFAQASSSSKITLADRYGLLAALLEDSLPEDERASIDRILYALYRGRMKVVSEISALSCEPPETNWTIPPIWNPSDLDRIIQQPKPSGVQAPAPVLSK